MQTPIKIIIIIIIIIAKSGDLPKQTHSPSVCFPQNQISSICLLLYITGLKHLLCNSDVFPPIDWISGTDYYWPLDWVVDGKALGTVLATVVGNVTIPKEKQNERNVFHFQASHAYLDAGQFTGQCITDTEDCHNGITVSFVVRLEDGAKTWTRKTFIVDTIGDVLLKSNRGFAVYVVNDELHVTVFSENRRWSVSYLFLVGIWQHVLFTWQRGHGLVLYVNGTER